MNRTWLILICSLLSLILLMVMRDKKTGRSALYMGAVKLQYWIGLGAAVLPTLATVIEELPERFQSAWRRERGEEFEVIRRKSA